MNERPANALTVDVEDYFHVAALAEVIKPGDWEQLPCRVEANCARLLELFERRQVKATFFMLGWVAERYPGLTRDIQAAGHEIACHGYSHQLVYNQEVAVFRDETLRAKALLEDQTGTAVRGYRAASYSVTQQSLWALDVLTEAGFEYDSSIFPIRHDRYGIPGAQRFPHRLEAPNGQTLAEFPLSAARVFGQTLPVAGGGYFRLFPYALSRWGLGSVNREGQPFIFYLHPWEVDPDQPRHRPRWFSRFRHYNNLDQTMPRLERLLGDFRFTTAAEVLQTAGLLSAPA